MCRLISITLLFVAISMALFAQGTHVYVINSDETWTASGSPYWIHNSITVPYNTVLTINANVEVIFQGNFNLTVNGKLMAQGTSATNCITFTAAEDSTWSGIIFDSRVTGSTITYAQFDKVSDGAVIKADNTHSLTIQDCVFCNNTISSNNAVDNRSLISITSCGNVIINDNIISNNEAENIIYLRNDFNDTVNDAETEVCRNKISHNIYFMTTMTVMNQNENTHINIEGNEVTHNSASTANSTSCILVIGRDIDVMNNTISDNHGCSIGGGLYVYANDGIFNIINNTISYNSAIDFGGGAYLYARTQVYFTENSIYANSANFGGGVAVEYSRVPLNDNFAGLETGLYIYKNAITHNFGNYGAGVYAGAGDIALVNNVIAYNNALDDAFLSYGIGVFLNPNGYNRFPTNEILINNIIWANDSYEIYFGLGQLDDFVYIRNTIIESGFNDTNYEPFMQSFIDTLAVYTADPLFVDPFDNDWHIQNKDYETEYLGFGDPYPDYVGIFPYDVNYIPTPHKRKFDAGWQWISFPKLPRDYMTNESVPFETVASTFYNNASQIQSQYGNATYNNTWSYPYALSDITSTMGFKVEVVSEFDHSIHGTTLNGSTEITLLPHIENWVGYFLPFTQFVVDAFDIKTLKKISSIKTIDGAVYITVNSVGGPGIGPNVDEIEFDIVSASGTFHCSYPYSNPYPYSTPYPYAHTSNFIPMPTLSFGEMAVVTLNRNITTDHKFRWVQKQVAPPFIRQKTKNFTFEKKADYQSLFIELESDNPPDEIGAFINGVCKGAVVYESEFSEILLYLDEADLDEEIEIAFAYDNTKALPKKVNDFAVVNPNNQQLEYKPLIATANAEYYHIKFAGASNGAPEVVVAPFMQLLQNYPNPFNPDTNIDFYLSHDDNVVLSIYNIKGQKVRDLLKGATPAGKHSVVWNGKDGTGNRVASGIYFYRLTTKLGSVQRKMVLVK